MKGRIRHLESLVVDLMNATNSKDVSPSDVYGDASHDEANLSKSGASLRDAVAHQSTNGMASGSTEEQIHGPEALGRMKISSTETSYVGGSHWTAILNEVGTLLFDEKYRHAWCAVD